MTMTERIPKGLLVGGAILVPFALAYLSYSRPGYFTSFTYLGGLLVLEFLFAAVWMYRRVFFPLVIVAFLFAGLNVSVGPGWQTLRWVFLGTGALVGSVIALKDHHLRLGSFHAFASFAVLAALVSAAVSRYPGFAVLKALSLLLLFVYGGTGVRLAVSGRENQFFTGLITGGELFIAGIAAFRLIGVEAMGNPNSLGAVTGVVGAPILLWGTLLAERSWAHYRRLALFIVCLYLVFHSHARAGMAAAFLSCGVMCLSLRRYKLLAEGLSAILVVVAAAAIFQPEAFSNRVSSVTSSVLYKGRDASLGVLSSRQEPWQNAVDTIREHFWFGTGFGTTDNGKDASEHLSMVESNQGVTAENGSSYLAIVTWVGMLGVLPFLLTILVLIAKVMQTVAWTWRTGNAFHPAIPLAMVVLAGLIHAGFEDWMFAPGYYLCVFFWSVAFILVDVTPSVPVPGLAFAWGQRQVRWSMGGVTPGR